MSLTERDYLKKFDIRIVILSRGRAGSIAERTLKLFPEWIDIIVPKEEVDAYANVCENKLIPLPEDIKGLGPTRNFALDFYDEETVIMVDDDLKYVYSVTGENSRRIEDFDEVLQIFINTAVMAKEAKTSMFGYNMVSIMAYHATQPFRVTGWVGGVIGVIGRKFRFIDDAMKVDVDFALQCMLVDRRVWIDYRYQFAFDIELNKGGSSTYRTQEALDQSIKNLRNRWGSALKISEGAHGSNMRTAINVPRKQAIAYD